MSDELTKRQRLFIIWYLRSRNATEAAKKAGYIVIRSSGED